MGLMFLIVLGAIIGWLTSIILVSEDGQVLLRNMAAGVAGALFGGLLFSPWAGSGSLLSETYQVSALLLSALGAMVLIASVNLFYRRNMR